MLDRHDTAADHLDASAPAASGAIDLGQPISTGGGNLSRAGEGNLSRVSDDNPSRAKATTTFLAGVTTTFLASEMTTFLGDDEGAEYDINLTGDAAQIGWRLVGANTKGMSRAGGNKLRVLVVMLAHIYRDGDEGFRARHPADASLRHLNSIIVGTAPVAELVDAGNAMLQGIGRTQRNNIMAWGFVFALPAALDADANWLQVLEWLRTNPTTAGLPILSAVVHRDQPGAGPHMHVTVLPVRAGERVGKPEPAVLRGSFGEFCWRVFGVRVGTPEERREAAHKAREARQKRKAKTLADLAASTGKGAQTAAAAAARDAAITARIDTVTGEIRPEETREGLSSRKTQMPCTQVSEPSTTTTPEEPSTTTASPTETETAHAAELARLQLALIESTAARDRAEARAASEAHEAASLRRQLAEARQKIADQERPELALASAPLIADQDPIHQDKHQPEPAAVEVLAERNQEPAPATVTDLDYKAASLLRMLLAAGKRLTLTEVGRRSRDGYPGLIVPKHTRPTALALVSMGLIDAKPSGKAFRHEQVPDYGLTAAGRALALQRAEALARPELARITPEPAAALHQDEPHPINNTAGQPVTRLSLGEFAAAVAAACRPDHQGDADAGRLLVQRVFFPLDALDRLRNREMTVGTGLGGLSCRLVKALKARGAVIGTIPTVSSAVA